MKMGLFMAIKHRSLINQTGRWGRWHSFSSRVNGFQLQKNKQKNLKIPQEIRGNNPRINRKNWEVGQMKKVEKKQGIAEE